jgi:hypothetical protein
MSDNLSTVLYGDLCTKVSLLEQIRTLTEAHYKVVLAEMRPWSSGNYKEISRAHRTCWAMAQHRACKELGLRSEELEVIRIWGTEKTPPTDAYRGKDVG